MGVPFCAFFSYLFSNKRLTHTIADSLRQNDLVHSIMFKHKDTSDRLLYRYFNSIKRYPFCLPETSVGG